MIDLEKAKETFLEQTKETKSVKEMQKQKHCLRVMENAKQIAKRIELDEEKVRNCNANWTSSRYWSF